MASLKFVNVNKIYDNNVQAVFDFNLEVKDKEFIVFVGPSGCGKSTTLRMVAGLESISTGELYINDKLVNYIAPKDRHIAMVFQSYALYPHMTVYDNMAFGLKIRKTLRPLFEYDDECKLVEKDIKSLRREYKKNSKAYSKAPNDNGIIEKEVDIRNKLNSLYAKLFTMRKPKMGIDEYRIARNEKQITKLKKEIITIEKYLVKEKSKAEVNEQLISVMERDIEYKNKEIAHYIEENNNFKNNEVQLERIRRLTKSEIDSQVLQVADVLDLIKYLSRKPAALSGGQRQRVALGRAIVRKPRVFLMDEPLSNLDAKLRVQTRSEIAKIHKKVGATTIYVTHDQTEAMTLADRIVIMKDGYIQQIAKPKEAYNNPSNMFVAGFIGSPAMNFIEGTFKKDKFVPIHSDNIVELNDEQIKLLKGYEDKAVVLGIRPENIHIGKAPKSVCSNEIKVKIDDFEVLGHEQILYSETFGSKFAIKTSAQEDYQSEQTISIYFDMGKVHFFNKDTTLKI